MRTKVIEAFNTLLDVPPDQLEKVIRVIDALHNASLL